MKFFFAQREHLPPPVAEFDLSPVQCHVLHLIEPGRPLPMGRLADTLVVRRVERHRPGRSAGIARPRRAAALRRRPPGEGAAAHADRIARSRAAAEADDQGSLPLSRLSLDQQRTLVRILEVLVDEPVT